MHIAFLARTSNSTCSPAPAMATPRLVVYSEEEELANRLTHGVGALLSLFGLFLLV